MTTHARVAIIGGGIVGCGILYHLAKRGWTDLVLLEKTELTAGATWHAAGNLSHYSSSAFWTRVQKATTELYKTLATEMGHPIGFHEAGSIRLATVPDHMVEHRRAYAKAKSLGVDMELIGLKEIKALFPFIELHDVLGGAFTPGCGSADPSSATYAMATLARQHGAKIRTNTKVTALEHLPTGEWRITTDKGELTAEIVVNAAGMWAPEVAALVGLKLPFVIFLHQHLVTESSPLIAALSRELPTLRDPLGGFNVRQEGKGLLSGVYEHEPEFWGIDGIPPAFGREVLPPHWERSQDFVDRAIARVPLLGELGIKMVYNAPTSRTPDHAPLVGPVPGLRNFFMAAGFSAGIMQSGATGVIAEWIAEGETSLDPAPIDVRRYGPYATKEFTYAVVRVGHKFAGAIDYPHGERGSGRLGKTGPLYERQRAKRALFGARNGWETPLWFAPEGTEPTETSRFGRPDWARHVDAECRRVREGAGLLDRTGRSVFELVGKGAAKALAGLSAGILPARDGEVRFMPFLTPKGGIAALLMVVRLDAERFRLMGPAEHEVRHFDWLWRNLLRDADTSLRNRTEQMGSLLLAGPRAREILESAAGGTLSEDSFPWGTARAIDLGMARVLALRFTAFGEDGWELHVPAPSLAPLYDALMSAGAAHGLGDVGLRAQEALQLEAGFPREGWDFDTTTTVAEAGFVRLIDEKHDTASKSARRVVCLAVEGGDADPYLNDAVLDGDRAVGLVASGGHDRHGKSCAFASLPAELAAPGRKLTVEILGKSCAATVVGVPFDGVRLPGDGGRDAKKAAAAE
ncbi:MAG: FAD-dependent oxidoreductase [Alphaproteobacteria bacterium]|nr:FAD-dependent oxidoreductase [Alphaproteobacteria bacterium]